MRIPLSILLIAAAALAVMFVIPNREVVTLQMWPFAAEFSGPLFLIVFGVLFAGFLLGWIGAWLAQHKWRRRARQQAKRIEKLEEELADAAASEPVKAAEISKIPRIPLGD